MKIYDKILSNGFKIIYSQDRSNPIISMQLHIRMGSAWEKPEEAGYSHFTEHLVFKSTPHFPGNAIYEKITFLGGYINAYTEYDSTCYFITLPADFADKSLEILSELVRNANFNDKEFEFEKKVVIEELKQIENDPEEWFLEKITDAYFQNNSYRLPIIGNLENLKKSIPENLRDFYKKYYVPNNCFLVISGDFSKSNLSELVKKYFGDWKLGSLHLEKPQSDELPSQSRFFSYIKKISNDILAIAFPDLSDTNPESYAQSIIMKTFLAGKNSRLYKRLFTQEKLIDTLKLHSVSGYNDGISILIIMPKKKADLNKILEIFFEELNHLQQFGLTETEIQETKRELIYFHKYTYEYVESLGSNLGSEELLIGYENFQKYPQIIGNLTKKILDNTISTYYKNKYFYIYHLGNKKIECNDLLKKISAEKVSAGAKIKKKDFHETRLESGVKIIMKRVLGKPTVGISLTSEVSQLNENFNNLGINLFTSGMFLYGNQKRDYEQLLKFCTTNGINCGVSPQSETTSLNLKCFAESLPISLELLADVVLTPLFPASHLENLKQTYISNLDRVKDYPQYYAMRLWKEMIFGKRSNLLNIEGSKTSIRNISRQQIINWFNTFYNLSNFSLAIVGDFDFSYVLDMCNKLFPLSPKDLKIPEQKAIFHSKDVRKKSLNMKSNQSIIILGGFGCTSREVQKNTAFHVLAQIIGGDTNSILFRELRENRGLAYSVDLEFRSFRSLGYYLITATVDNEKCNESLDLIIQLL